MNIPFDFHTHTTFSPDADNTAREMVEKAMSCGMEYYAITDHIEVNIFYDNEIYLKTYGVDFNQEDTLSRSSVLIPALKKEYDGKIKLLYGIEIGEPIHNVPLADIILQKFPFDFVLGSCHSIRYYDDFYYLDYKSIDINKALKQYFDEMLELCEWGHFDSLAHITYPLRYILKAGMNADMEKYSKIITKIFATIIKKDIALEINTSGMRDDMQCFLPNEPYVKEYYDMGGRLVTIGSDAHRTNHLGKGIIEAIAFAKKIGFKEVAYFEERKIHLIPIV